MEKIYKGFVSYALFLLNPLFVLRSEKVCRSGSPGTEMFFLIEGECEQLDNVSRNVRVLGESSQFEEYALLATPEEMYRKQTTVTVLTPTCQLYSLTVKNFMYPSLIYFLGSYTELTLVYFVGAFRIFPLRLAGILAMN